MFTTTYRQVIIANPQRMFVETLKCAVEGEGRPVVHTATTRSALLEALRSSPTAMCLSAWTFPDGALADAMPDIRSVAPDATIVVLGNHTDPTVLSTALAIGVQGFIHTSRGLDVLLAALPRLQSGEVVIEASLTRSRPADDGDIRVRELARYLTPRESECLALIVAGLDTAAMARRLGVSRTTIRSHVQAMLIKLGVHSRLEAAALAVHHRLLPDGDPMELAAGI